MFNDFLTFFDVKKTIAYNADTYRTFVTELGGISYGEGLFTSFADTDIEKWTSIAEGAYPGLKGHIKPFGHDWLGRTFVVDLREARKGQILMLEIGTGMALEIPCTLELFLDEEIILNSDACLANSFYEGWRSLGNPAPKYGECVGYKIPLFLGGSDDVTNLEISDMEVYWGITSQLKP